MIAVLAGAPACTLFQSQERSDLTALPDAGTVNDACHGGGDGGCCSQAHDAGTPTWPDGAPDDGGGYLPDGGWVPDAGVFTVDGGSYVPDGGP
jgi:hypothetical protein